MLREDESVMPRRHGGAAQRRAVPNPTAAAAVAVARARPAAPTVALLAAAAVIGLLHYLIVLPPGILSGRHPGWVNPPGDVGGMLLGAEALLRGPWGLPLAQTPLLLSDGNPVSVVFTDSAPWIALLLKAFGATPEAVSVMGVVLLLCFLLQPIAFALLLLALGVRRAEVLLLGATLGALMPAWLARMVAHVALSSHWLVLLALALAVLAIRRGVTLRIALGFAGLGALAIGIHSYLWVCVVAVAMGALLADAARRLALGPALVGCGAILAVLAASAGASAVLGFTLGVGPTEGFGLHSMNLLSPWWPQYSGLVRLLGGGDAPLVDATGGQWEGFNYFGAGLLLVMAAAAVRLLRRAPRPSAEAGRAALPLAAALVGLAALALSGEVYLGQRKLLSLQPPSWLAPFVAQIRGSGRLFWPMGYLLAAMGIAWLAKAERRGPAALFLLAAVLLQWVDVAPLRGPLHRVYESPASYAFDPGPWRAADFSGAVAEIVPPGVCAMSGAAQLPMIQVALIAFRRHAVLESPTMARSLRGDCATVRQEAVQAILDPEPMPPGRVRVLFTADLPEAPGWEHVPLLRRECRAFELGLVCGEADRIASFAALPPAPGFPPLAPGEAARFGQDERWRVMLHGGWSLPEPWGVWSNGSRAKLRIHLREPSQGPARLAADAIAFIPPGRMHQRVVLRVGEDQVAEWRLGAAPARFEFTIPAEAIMEGGAVLTLQLPDAVSPREVGLSRDARRLGIGLIGVTLLGPE